MLVAIRVEKAAKAVGVPLTRAAVGEVTEITETGEKITAVFSSGGLPTGGKTIIRRTRGALRGRAICTGQRRFWSQEAIPPMTCADIVRVTEGPRRVVMETTETRSTITMTTKLIIGTTTTRTPVYRGSGSSITGGATSNNYRPARVPTTAL